MSKSIPAILMGLAPKILKGNIGPADLAPLLEHAEPHLVAWLRKLELDNLQPGEHHIALNTVVNADKICLYVVTVSETGQIRRTLGEPYTVKSIPGRLIAPPEEAAPQSLAPSSKPKSTPDEY